MGWFCKHKWKVLKVIEITDHNDYLICYKYVLQCENCGKVKGKRI